MRWGLGALVAVAVVAPGTLAACGGGRSGAADGPADARPCDYSECQGHGLECRSDGLCHDVCDGVPGGVACINYQYPSECCPPGTRCCTDGFEHSGCHSGECPQLCQRPPGWSEAHCPAGSYCLYQFPAGVPIPPDGVCDFVSGIPYELSDSLIACVADCPAERQCAFSWMCCGENTRCKDSYDPSDPGYTGPCCVANQPDGGIPDGGLRDAAPADAGAG
jgi:hypothetical protein